MLPSILQTNVIDVSTWKLDDQFGSYPEGAREKSAFFAPDGIGLDFINIEKRYLFKRSRKMYPDHFWTEIVAYQIGCLLGVEVPPAFASYNSDDDTCGALIEWFYIDNTAIYVQGGNYMQLAIPEFERRVGEQHNYHTLILISRAISIHTSLLKDWQIYWGEAFLFDALIGNTDRHQDNWGILYWLDSPTGVTKANFSPLFDNGTSLGYERFPDHVKGWTDARFKEYVLRGKHHMRWELNSPEQAKHIEMVKLVTNGNESLKNHLFDMINSFSLKEFRHKLHALENIEMPVRLSKERSDLFFKLVSIRHDLLCNALR